MVSTAAEPERITNNPSYPHPGTSAINTADSEPNADGDHDADINPDPHSNRAHIRCDEWHRLLRI